MEMKMRDIGDEEVRDGESVHVRMRMMDSARGYRSGYVRLSDAQVAARERVRAKWIKQMTDAWRMDARRKRDDDDDDDDDEVQGASGQGRTDPRRIGRSAVDARAAATASYYQMVRRLQDAWRTPIRDAGEPDAATRLLGRGNGEPDSNNAEGLMRRHMRGDEPPDASVAAKAWSQRNTMLENAWRGQTDPGRADELERQRKSENWMHGA
jgi:hypothetical protein